MKRDIKLPFGLNVDGVLVHISEVGNGKNCNCYCPSCKSPLIAAKGRQIQHHFKHHIIHECDGGLESAIHLTAKKLFEKKTDNPAKIHHHCIAYRFMGKSIHYCSVL